MVKLSRKKYDRVSVNLTWKCNLGNCPYCWVNRAVRGDPSSYSKEDHDYREWLNAFKQLDPAILDFVGGEPFIFPNFVELIANLPKKHKYAPTSNLHSDKIFDFVEKCQPDRCVSFTASFHPTGKLEMKEFANRVQLFIDHEFPTSVNIVNYPELASQILLAYDYFKNKRFVTHLSPYEVFENVLLPFNGLFTCTAGISRYVISNMGDVYSCFTWFKHLSRRKEAFMGNIFDGTFRKYSKKKTCNIRCEPFLVYDPTDGMVPDMHIKPLRLPQKELKNVRSVRKVLGRENIIKNLRVLDKELAMERLRALGYL